MQIDHWVDMNHRGLRGLVIAVCTLVTRPAKKENINNGEKEKRRLMAIIMSEGCLRERAWRFRVRGRECDVYNDAACLYDVILAFTGFLHFSLPSENR